jgi:hypothetical protein
MSMQNKRTLFIVFALAIFVICIYAFASTQDSVTLREYVDLRFAEMQRAIDKAYLTNEADKAKMNEIRGSLNDAQKTFASKDAVDKLNDAQKMFASKDMVDKMQEDIKALRSLSDIAQGKASQTSLFVVGMVSFLSLAIQISKIYIDKKKK